LFGSNNIRTGIDLGTGSVKLVRGVGSNRLKRITHIGAASWDGEGSEDSAIRASEALKRVLERLNLSPRKLGRVAVAVRMQEASIREVTMPPMEESELAQAVGFEARKHLDLEDMMAPVIASQYMGRTADAKGEEQSRVLLAAVPKPVRDFPLQVLGKAGIKAEIVDLEALAGLNAAFAVHEEMPQDSALGVIDFGNWHVEMHLASPAGGLLSRRIGPGVPEKDDPDAIDDYIEDLVGQMSETMTFYRGRYRRELAAIYLAGGGALVPGLAGKIGEAIGRPVQLLDPIGDIAQKAEGIHAAEDFRPRFATACGLCRWWDGSDV